MNIENKEVMAKMSGGLGEDKMSGGQGEDKPLYLSPRQDSPTMDELVLAPAILEAVHLHKYFPLRQFKLFGPRSMVHAVEDTSLALSPGRALALVGESGSGKTTVARMLARLYEPTARTIKFRGEPVKVQGKA